MIYEVSKNCHMNVSRDSALGSEKCLFLIMILGSLASLIILNLFFVEYGYASFNTKKITNQFERNVQYSLPLPFFGKNYFVLQYEVSGGISGSLDRSTENITYDSKSNGLSGNCASEPVHGTLSDSDVKNLELMIHQNKELFTTSREYSSSQNGADRYNYNLTIANDGGEHYSTWMSNTDIPTNLTKIAEEIHRIACKK